MRLLFCLLKVLRVKYYNDLILHNISMLRYANIFIFNQILLNKFNVNVSDVTKLE